MPRAINEVIEDAYLGDGVYASSDGYYIHLDLRGQDSTTKIALEPPVFEALIQFKAAVDAANAKAEKDLTQAEKK